MDQHHVLDQEPLQMLHRLMLSIIKRSVKHQHHLKNQLSQLISDQLHNPLNLSLLLLNQSLLLLLLPTFVRAVVLVRLEAGSVPDVEPSYNK